MSLPDPPGPDRPGAARCNRVVEARESRRGVVALNGSPGRGGWEGEGGGVLGLNRCARTGPSDTKRLVPYPPLSPTPRLNAAVIV